MPYLGIFGLEFEKAIVIFEISTLEFGLKKAKITEFGTKNALFEYFGLEFEKNYCRILKRPQIYLITIFTKKKMPKFGTKNVLFGYFWDRI